MQLVMASLSSALLAVLLVSCASNPEDWAPVPVAGGGVTADRAAEGDGREVEADEPVGQPAAEPARETTRQPETPASAPAEPGGSSSTDGFEYASVSVPAGGSYPTAEAAEGFTGQVISPYNGEMVNVAGIPSGTLVADPRYPEEEEKFFRVP